jgi:predicted phage tail protein
MTTIILHGYLRELHPAEIQVEANSAAEALSSLQLIPALAGDGSKRHHVAVDGFASADALYDKRKVDVLHVRPVMTGSGRSGATQVVIGIMLIATAAMGGIPALGITSGMLYLSGGMMVLGGVLQLLAPQPKLDTSEKSKYLGSGKNTVAIGTRIPMIYGRCKAYGHYISFDIDSGAFNSAPEPWYSSPFTDYGTLTHSSVDPQIPVTDPQVLDQSPVSTYQGLTYPDSMVEEMVTYITFAPTVLLAGPYDLSFATGQTFHVENATAGTTSKVTLLGGDISNMPPVGTNIVFTRSYD